MRFTVTPTVPVFLRFLLSHAAKDNSARGHYTSNWPGYGQAYCTNGPRDGRRKELKTVTSMRPLHPDRHVLYSCISKVMANLPKEGCVSTEMAKWADSMPVAGLKWTMSTYCRVWVECPDRTKRRTITQLQQGAMPGTMVAYGGFGQLGWDFVRPRFSECHR